MNEKAEFFPVTGGKMWCRHRLSDAQQPTILLIHGLGDCSQSFDQAFQASAMLDCNLLAADLLGYGKSVDDSDCDYSFSAHVERLNALIANYANPHQGVFVVGHSLGGDLATHLVSSRKNTRFCGIVNIEGNLTPGDLFISRAAIDAESRGEFRHWFAQDFRQQQVLQQWAKQWPSCQHYNDALEVCRTREFLDNASELCQRNQQVPGDLESETGRIFRLLDMPKMFCRGSEPLSEETEQLLDGATPTIASSQPSDSMTRSTGSWLTSTSSSIRGSPNSCGHTRRAPVSWNFLLAASNAGLTRQRGTSLAF